MEITEITVGWTETCSLPEYTNVRPSVTMTARLRKGEGAGEAVGALMDDCKRVVQSEIDDALELHDRPTKYYSGPRYQVLYSRQHKATLVLPDEVKEWPEHFSHLFNQCSRGLRLNVAQTKALTWADEQGQGWTVHDCSDGDLSRVPAIVESGNPAVPAPDQDGEDVPF